jgi:hypothetical protein
MKYCEADKPSEEFLWVLSCRYKKVPRLSGAAAGESSCHVNKGVVLKRILQEDMLTDLKLKTDHPGGHCIGRPASKCKWMWKTLCPAMRLQFMTSR